MTDALIQLGVDLQSPCGGRGVCGKCRVIWKSPDIQPKDASGVILTPDAFGAVLACRATVPDTGCTVGVPRLVGTGLTVDKTSSEKASVPLTETSRTGFCGWALDIGTTTLALALVAVSEKTGKGEPILTTSSLNPQHIMGADVIGRIQASNEHLDKLTGLVRGSVAQMVRELTSRLPDDDRRVIESAGLPMTVAGNTTMLHLFAGVSPVSMGSFPFTPAFTDVREILCPEFGDTVGKVILLPSVSAYIGGDVVCGMYACDLEKYPHPTLFLDCGTNGEMALFSGTEYGSRLVCASTAAGPALEGAGISCGMGGVRGAVSVVSGSHRAGLLTYQTIGDCSPSGVCGSGLIDWIACLLDSGCIDGTGRFDSTAPPVLAVHKKSDGSLCDSPSPLSLTQKDVRQVQLAKSAICAGILTLLDAEHLDAPEFLRRGGRVLLAGGLGYYLSPVSSQRVGLIPDGWAPVVTAVGNSALSGAVCAVADSRAIESMRSLASRCRVCELSTSPVFNDAFIDCMMFEADDD